VAQATVPSPESRLSKNSFSPSATAAGVSGPFGGITVAVSVAGNPTWFGDRGCANDPAFGNGGASPDLSAGGGPAAFPVVTGSAKIPEASAGNATAAPNRAADSFGIELLCEPFEPGCDCFAFFEWNRCIFLAAAELCVSGGVPKTG